MCVFVFTQIPLSFMCMLFRDIIIFSLVIMVLIVVSKGILQSETEKKKVLWIV